MHYIYLLLSQLYATALAIWAPFGLELLTAQQEFSTGSSEAKRFCVRPNESDNCDANGTISKYSHIYQNLLTYTQPTHAHAHAHMRVVTDEKCATKRRSKCSWTLGAPMNEELDEWMNGWVGWRLGWMVWNELNLLKTHQFKFNQMKIIVV